MRRRHRRIALLALSTLVGSALVTTGPAGAEPAAPSATANRSQLENPETVRLVHIRLTGAEMLDKVAAAGFDLEHGLRRVPNGIEGEAVVTAEQTAELTAMGVEVLGDDAGFAWSDEADGGIGAAGTRAIQPANHEATVRVVRADWFTTKGQGFLYVEARTTEGQQANPIVGMQVENDTGKGTPFGFARTMSRFVDSGQYMFHRNLFKLDVRPDKIQVTSSTGGVATGVVSNWLENAPPPLTANPSYKSDFVDGYRNPQQLYSRAKRDRPPVPGHRRDRLPAEPDERVPAQGAGPDRRYGAGRGRRHLGGVGPRGRQRHHCGLRGPARAGPAARGGGRRQGGPGPARHGRRRRARRARPPRWPRRCGPGPRASSTGRTRTAPTGAPESSPRRPGRSR